MKIKVTWQGSRTLEYTREFIQDVADEAGQSFDDALHDAIWRDIDEEMNRSVEWKVDEA